MNPEGVTLRRQCRILNRNPVSFLIGLKTVHLAGNCGDQGQNYMPTLPGQDIESAASSTVVHGFYPYSSLDEPLEQLGSGKLNALSTAK